MSDPTNEKEQPTDEGTRRCPPNGTYEGIPCTCTPACPWDCKGACGCAACRAAYSDALEEFG